MNCLIGCPSCYRGLLASFILLTRLSIDICSEIGRTSQGDGLVRQTAAPAVRGSVAVRGSPDPAQVADRRSPSRFLAKDRPAWSRHVGSGDLRSSISARSGDLRRARKASASRRRWLACWLIVSESISPVPFCIPRSMLHWETRYRRLRVHIGSNGSGLIDWPRQCPRLHCSQVLIAIPRLARQRHRLLFIVSPCWSLVAARAHLAIYRARGRGPRI